MGEAARYFVDGRQAVGSWRNVLLVIWLQPPSSKALAAVSDAASSLLQSFPSGIGFIGVGSAEEPLDSAEHHRWLARNLPRLLGMASVIEGHGSTAGATRNVMKAISRVATQPCPARVFEDVDEAAAWMAPLMCGEDAPSATALELRRAVEGLRALLSTIN